MNICADSALKVVKTNSNLTFFSNLANRQVDKTTQAAAQTILQRFSTFFSEPLTPLPSYATKFSPLNLFSPAAQTVKGMVKFVFVAALISSKVVTPVAADLQISAPASYVVIPGANVTLNNPPISVTWTFQNDISGGFDLQLPLQGMLYSPQLLFSPPNSFIFWGKQNSINSNILQNIVFRGNLTNIMTTLGVYFTALDPTTSQQKIVRANITLAGTYSPSITTNPSTNGAATLLGTSTQTSSPNTFSTISSGTQQTISQLIPSGSSSALQTKSIVSNLFSSMTSIATEQSQNIATGLLVTTASILTSPSQRETQLDPNQINSTPNDFNRYGWIIVAVAGVAFLCSMFGLAGYVFHRKKLKAKPEEPKLVSKSNDRRSSTVTARHETTVPINPRAPYPQQEPQFFDAHSARERQGIVASQHYVNAPGNVNLYRTAQLSNSAVFENHQYVNVAIVNQNPQACVRTSNGLGYMFIPSSHYDNPHDRIMELELNPQPSPYVGINDV